MMICTNKLQLLCSAVLPVMVHTISCFSTRSDEDRLKALTGPKPITIEFKRPKIKDTYYEVECHDIRLGKLYTVNCIVDNSDRSRDTGRVHS